MLDNTVTFIIKRDVGNQILTEISDDEFVRYDFIRPSEIGILQRFPLHPVMVAGVVMATVVMVVMVTIVMVSEIIE